MLSDNAPPISRLISKTRDPELVKRDLDEMVRLTVDQGAHQAILVSGRDVEFNRDLAKPRDGESPENRSEHWPARYPLDSFKDALKTFKNGVFFSYPIPPGMADQGQGWIENHTYRQACLRLASILTAVESDAFYRGYHLAAGYGAGNCRTVFCHKENRCRSMLSGRGCVHPYKARPSMAAVGIDAPAMGGKLGLSSNADQVYLYGLVMIF